MANRVDYLLHYFHRLQANNFDVMIMVSGSKGFGKSTASIYLAKRYLELFSYICPHCGRHGFKNFYSIRNEDTETPEFYIPEVVLNDTANLLCKQEYELDRKTGKKVLTTGCGKKFKWSQRKKIPWRAEDNIAYDNEDVIEKVTSLPNYSPVILDEAMRFAAGMQHATRDSKYIKQIFNVIRPKRYLMFLCIPEMTWLDSKYREGFSSFWLRMIERGVGVLFEKDKGEAKDKYHLKELDKAMGTIKFFTPMDKIKRNLKKLPTYFDMFKIPDLSEKVYNDYEMVRNSVTLQRQAEEMELSNKDMAKIAAYNISTEWDRIKMAVNKTRDNKITYEILLREIFVNPLDRKSLASEPTIRNWIKGVKDYVKSKGKDAHSFDIRENLEEDKKTAK